jgi:hypothetical protein
MSYTAGEALALARLREISGSLWTSDNSGRGTWYMLNTGKASRYAFLKPGPGKNDFISINTSVRTYATMIEIWQAYVNDGTSLTNLQAYQEAILDKFDNSRLLGDTGGTIQDSRCIALGEPQEMWTAGGNGPFWLRQDFQIQWKEENTVEFSGPGGSFSTPYRAAVTEGLKYEEAGAWLGSNIFRGDWLPLNDGRYDHYAIFRDVPSDNDFMSINRSLRTQRIVAEIWQAYVDDGSSLTNLEAYMEGIIDVYDAYPRGFATNIDYVLDQRCVEWSEVTEQWRKGGNGPAWLKQEFTIEWKEENAVTFA